MTTIVYDHKAKLIAVDGRQTGDDVVLNDNHQKWVITDDGSVWFLCGQSCEFELLINSYYGKDDPKRELHANAFRVFGSHVHMHGYDGSRHWSHGVTASRAIGSGCQFAMAALDFGKSVKDAVKYAATRDIYTGGKIRVYDIASGKFI